MPEEEKKRNEPDIFGELVLIPGVFFDDTQHNTEWLQIIHEARMQEAEKVRYKKNEITPEMMSRFRLVVQFCEHRYGGDPERLSDENAESELRKWLDGNDQPLDWSGPHVTADEWFFITTLYGEMTLKGQRSHIRTFFSPLFVEAAQRDIRNFVPGMEAFTGLRSAWMARRLCRMGALLREREITMTNYVQHLQALESQATLDNPMPALDAIIRDHQATGWKTLSVFVRDCVGGNCFPIDSRVQKELDKRGLPVNERLLVSLSLALNKNPRQVARMFYEAGGE